MTKSHTGTNIEARSGENNITPMNCKSIACIWSDCPPPHIVTAAAVLDSPATLYTGGSDGTIVCWNISTTVSNTVSIANANPRLIVSENYINLSRIRVPDMSRIRDNSNVCCIICTHCVCISVSDHYCTVYIKLSCELI